MNTFTDPRDGKTYKTVKIGNYTWMAENLNYECEGSKFYDNDPANGEKYGRLYDWETAKKACPTGWHLPNYEEFSVLLKASDKGGLKTTSGWSDKGDGKSGNGTDALGFSALPGGNGGSNGNFNLVGKCGMWWTSTNDDILNISSNEDDMYCSKVTGTSLKNFLFSVRCVKDDIFGTFTDPRDGKIYKTVRIGSQTWMAENLNYECEGSKCQKNDPCYAKIYGRLYGLESLAKVCPPGWHIPSKEEWRALVDYAGGFDMSGKMLKAKSGWELYNEFYNRNGNGTDVFGFAALPGGCFQHGEFGGIYYMGFWWGSTTCTDGSGYGLYYHWMSDENNNSQWEYHDPKYYFHSVRCVKDMEGACPSCGKINLPETKFCRECGAKLLNMGLNNCTGTANTFTDPRDGKTYKTVKIGNHTWMAENLNYECEGSKFYDNDPANGEKYGRLYDWETAKKACPPGWHLPNYEEFSALLKASAKGGLKTTSGWSDKGDGKSGNGTDALGFSALPGGNSGSNASFNLVGKCGMWWTSTNDYILNMSSNEDDMFYSKVTNTNIKNFLLSVRYVQDIDTFSSTGTNEPLIIMLVGAVIGGIIVGPIVGAGLGGTKAGFLTGILIGVFFGTGLGPFLRSVMKFLNSGSLTRIMEGVSKNKKRGDTFWMLLFTSLFFWAIKGFFVLGWALIESPFIAISQFSSEVRKFTEGFFGKNSFK